MRALVQRVASARVRVGGEVVGAIDRGLLMFVGVMRDDVAGDEEWVVRKVTGLRVFPDEQGMMNKSVVEVGGRVLLVSQFTLAADTDRGARPSFGAAMAPAGARRVLARLAELLSRSVAVEQGQFGADMQVELVNDGPVTLWLDSRARS
jgi:D-tyrosyl-tRNA(Tyr) deacylase